MLHIHDLTYRIGERLLLDDASVSLSAGTRTALVGRNGSGKSTLLALIRHALVPESGTIEVHPRARVVSVAQEAPSGDASPLATVLAADTERQALLTDAETETDPDRIAQIQTRLADIGAHAAEARAGAILHGLGFDSDAQNGPLDSLSGGWRMRVALAAALFVESDLLLLDEPTNHLDLEATVWLESYLARFSRTLLLVSHDRNLINRVATHTLHLHRRRLTLYRGGFDAFVRARDEQRAVLAKQRARQEAARAHMTAFVERFRAKATKARQAQSRIKALARMAPILPDEDEADVTLSFPDPEPLASPLLTLERVSVGYEPAKPVLRDLTLRLDLDDRIALLGANGNGKTTLLRLLSDRLAPLDGARARVPKLRVAYYTQDQQDTLTQDHSAIDHVAARMADANETAVRGHLGRFGLSGSVAENLVRDLSGGEKARLLLALMCLEKPHVLLLDEPTNHLDIESREALVRAVNEFRGAVILISHDRHLIELCAERLWLVADGGCTPFDGDVAAYEAMLRGTNRDTGPRKPATPAGGNARKAQRRDAAERRSALAPLKRAVADAEAALQRLEAERESVEAALADPSTHGLPERIAELGKKRAALARDTEAAEDAWLAAQHALEEAMAPPKA